MTLRHLDGIKTLSREEARALFDEHAKTYFHMGGDEFVASWNAGKFVGREDDPDVIAMVMLLPLVAD